MRNAVRLAVLCLLVGAVPLVMRASPASGSAVITSAAETTAALVTPSVDAFRAALGTLNPSVAGSFASGRREINWDGVPDSQAAPNNLAPDFFNVTSPRGVVLSTPGTGFQVSANIGGATPVRFGNIDPTYPSTFGTFSAQRLFTALGSNVVDVTFFVPGTTTPATVAGFGVVFTDVDLGEITSMEFFDADDNSLGAFPVPAISGDATFSFLGATFDAGERIRRVRIISGSTELAPGVVDGQSTDLVAMDDFIFGEPQALDGTSTTLAPTTTTTVPTTTTTTTPPPPPPCTTNLTGDVVGSRTVRAGERLCLAGARLAGAITVERGGSLTITGSDVSQAVSTNGAAHVRICGSRLGRGLTVAGSSASLVVGDPATGCPANEISLPGVTLTGNTAGLVLGGNSVSGVVTVNSNSGGGIVVKASRVSGNLDCSANNPAPTNASQPNIVTGTKSGQCTGL